MSEPPPDDARPLAQPWPDRREPAGQSVFWKFATVTLFTVLLVGIGGRWVFLKAWNNYVPIASSSNLRAIGLSLRLYANAHDGQLPGDWSQLLLDPSVELTSDCFANGNAPQDDSWRTLSKPEQAKLIAMSGSMHCTYVFTAAGLMATDLPPDTVLAFEPPEAYDGRGALVLTADNSCEWIDVNAPSGRAAYDRFLADVARGGVRPVRWKAGAATTTAPTTTSSAGTYP